MPGQKLPLRTDVSGNRWLGLSPGFAWIWQPQQTSQTSKDRSMTANDLWKEERRVASLKACSRESTKSRQKTSTTLSALGSLLWLGHVVLFKLCHPCEWSGIRYQIVISHESCQYVQIQNRLCERVASNYLEIRRLSQHVTYSWLQAKRPFTMCRLQLETKCELFKIRLDEASSSKAPIRSDKSKLYFYPLPLHPSYFCLWSPLTLFIKQIHHADTLQCRP